MNDKSKNVLGALALPASWHNDPKCQRVIVVNPARGLGLEAQCATCCVSVDLEAVADRVTLEDSFRAPVH